MARFKTKGVITIEELMKMVVDSTGNPKEDQNLAVFYFFLEHEEKMEERKISVQRMEAFLNSRRKERKLVEARKLFSADNFEALQQRDRKLERKRVELEKYLRSIRTLDNAYEYSLTIHDAIDKIAPKLDASKEMESIERTKWLSRMWFCLFRDQWYLWADFDCFGSIDFQSIGYRDNECIVPNSMIEMSKFFEAKVFDADISLEQLQAFVSKLPDDVQAEVYSFAELDGKNVPYNIQVSFIRALKRKIFPTLFKLPLYYFIGKNGMAAFRPEMLVDAIRIYTNRSLMNQPKAFEQIQTSTDRKKDLKRFVYLLGYYQIGNTKKPIYVSGQMELEMYIEVYRWLQRHENFKFGLEKKTLSEYGIENLSLEFVTVDNQIQNWVMDMQFANSVDDVNMEVARQIFNNKELKVALNAYSCKMATAEEVFEKTGIKDRNQGIACFNSRANFGKNMENEMWQSLRRIKTFGMEKALPHDKAYFALFCYCMNNEERKAQLSKPQLRIYEKLIAA